MKNKTQVSIEIQKELMKITTKKSKISFLIVGIMLIFLGILMYPYDNHESIIFAVSIGIAVGGFFVILIFVMFWDKLLLKQVKNNTLLKGDIYNEYEFNENGFNVNTTRDEENIGQSILKYSDVVKVIESEQSLFIFVSNIQAFTLSKEGMFEGSVHDLITLIKSKIVNYKIVR